MGAIEQVSCLRRRHGADAAGWRADRPLLPLSGTRTVSLFLGSRQTRTGSVRQELSDGGMAAGLDPSSAEHRAARGADAGSSARAAARSQGLGAARREGL